MYKVTPSLAASSLSLAAPPHPPPALAPRCSPAPRGRARSVGIPSFARRAPELPLPVGQLAVQRPASQAATLPDGVVGVLYGQLIERRRPAPP